MARPLVQLPPWAKPRLKRGILYGAEFTGGTETTLLDNASAKQHEIAKEISLITFRHVIHTILWKEEYDKRLEICNKSPRLQLIATEDRRAKIQRKRWPGVSYLSFVDSKFHARLLAMTRLGVLPIEIEIGRWYGIPREQRRCSLGCDHIGDTAHFLHRCEHIAYYNRTYKLT